MCVHTHCTAPPPSSSPPCPAASSSISSSSRPTLTSSSRAVGSEARRCASDLEGESSWAEDWTSGLVLAGWDPPVRNERGVCAESSGRSAGWHASVEIREEGGRDVSSAGLREDREADGDMLLLDLLGVLVFSNLVWLLLLLLLLYFSLCPCAVEEDPLLLEGDFEMSGRCWLLPLIRARCW